MRKSVQNQQWHPPLIFSHFEQIFDPESILERISFLSYETPTFFLRPVEVSSHCRSWTKLYVCKRKLIKTLTWPEEWGRRRRRRRRQRPPPGWGGSWELASSHTNSLFSWATYLVRPFEASLYAARSRFGRFFNTSRFGGFPKKGFLSKFGSARPLLVTRVYLKGLSHEIDFKNFDKKLHNLA
jgi:hypothetical protein